MKLMVDISSSSREELPSAAIPVAAPVHPTMHVPPSCTRRMGPPKRAPDPNKSPSRFPAGGMVCWSGKKSHAASWLPSWMPWDAQRRAGVAIPGDGVYCFIYGFPQDSRRC